MLIYTIKGVCRPLGLPITERVRDDSIGNAQNEQYAVNGV